MPPVLTNNLGVTVAGTLSMAGLGVASFRYGTQADNVVELEVVTGAGEIVVCSREQNRELFDMVRCGLGAVRDHHPRQDAPAPLQAAGCACTPCSTTTSASSWRTPLKVMDPENPTFSLPGVLLHALLPGFRKIGEGMELREGCRASPTGCSRCS